MTHTRAEAFGKEKSYTVFVHPAVFEFLIENNEEQLTLLRSSTNLNIDIVVDAKISIEEFYCFSTKRFADVTSDFNPGKKPMTSTSHSDARHASALSQQAVPAKSLESSQNDPAWASSEIKYGRKPRSARRR